MNRRGIAFDPRDKKSLCGNEVTLSRNRTQHFVKPDTRRSLPNQEFPAVRGYLAQHQELASFGMGSPAS
jgi:hypothetical protein